jgi:hypothetical protein
MLKEAFMANFIPLFLNMPRETDGTLAHPQDSLSVGHELNLGFLVLKQE